MTNQKPAKPRKTAKRSYQKHGLCLLKRAVKELGNRAIDRRTTVGRELARWHGNVLNDLGGPDAVSAQQLAVLNTASKTMLLLDSADSFLLSQPSLVNRRKKALYPVVLQRQQLADSLLRQLSALGLERKAKHVTDLKTYLNERASAGNRSEGELRGSHEGELHASGTRREGETQ